MDPQKGPQDKAKMNVEADADETLLWQIEGRVSEFKVYDFSQVMEATSNFSERNKLGQGGFGPVYKVRNKIEIILPTTCLGSWVFFLYY